MLRVNSCSPRRMIGSHTCFCGAGVNSRSPLKCVLLASVYCFDREAMIAWTSGEPECDRALFVVAPHLASTQKTCCPERHSAPSVSTLRSAVALQLVEFHDRSSGARTFTIFTKGAGNVGC